MRRWIQERWQQATTKPCDACGAEIPVSAYRETGETRKGSWWEGDTVELRCPNCGDRFWSKK